jgi:hypothetical protein
MNTKEAAEKWRVTQGTVSRWCKNGWIESAKKDLATREWEISDDAIRPHIFSNKKQETHIKRSLLILEALSMRRVIPLSKLNYNTTDIKEHFDELCSLDLVKKKKVNLDHRNFFFTYVPTIKGDEFLKNRNSSKIKHENVKTLIQALKVLGLLGSLV